MTHSLGIKPISKLKVVLFSVLALIIIAAGGTWFASSRLKVNAAEADAFVTTWRVAGDAAGRTIIIPISSLLNQYAHLGPIVINFTIDWGDGAPLETFTNASLVGAPRISHTYATPGDYQVKIRGSFPGWDMGSLSGDAKANANKIISLDQWGTSKWRSMENAFYYAENMVAKYADQPDTSLVTNMHQAFAFARKFNGRINFNTGNVEKMSSVFHEANAFNSPITFSDTSKVTNMSGMFLGAVNFNQPINFNTTNVTNMGSMFQRTTRFNQPLQLDTQNVTNMIRMFQQSGFNQPLNFNTAKVQDMSSMFMSAPKFNQPLNFDTISVKNMSAMFSNSPQNSPLNFSDTSQVTNMSMMFHLSKFNQPLNFDTRSVTTMDSMFSNSAFNQPINFNGQNLVSTKKMFAGNRTFNSTVTLSNTTKLNDVSGMFSQAVRFNQPITFSTSAVTNVSEMFKEATAFNQDLSNFNFNKVASGKLLDFASNSGLSTTNNDRLIKRWRQQLSGLTNQQPKSTGLKFCKAEADRTILVGKGWVFEDTRDCSSYMQAPVDIILPAESFDENNTANTHLTNITVQNHPDDNPDDVNTVTLSCAIPGPDDNAFKVEGNRLIFKPVADYETKNSYSFCLRATDTANLFIDKNFTITVRDVNEAPSITPQNFSVAENSPNGTEIGQIVANDPDNGQTLSYEIVSGNNLNIFEITAGGKLKVKNNANLDYEQAQQVVLAVKVKDSGSPQLSAQANITIAITNVNEAPGFTSLANITVNEDETKVHTLTASDPENGALTFSSDNLPAWITLAGDKLTLKPAQAQVGSHQITVKVSDGHNTVSQVINIQVNNVNDAPVVTSSPILQATKREAYSYIISATDEDGDALTYSATTKPAWLHFNPATRELSGTPDNDEAGNSYPIVLTVSDGTTSTNQSFSIFVNDKNYAPTIADQSFNLNENAANGTEVYQIIASDPDNHPLHYEISSGNSLNIFEVTADGKLKIKNNYNLDYELTRRVVLHVRAIDNQSPALSAEAKLTVNIQDVNEAPNFTSADHVNLKHIDTKVYTLTASDPENDALTFSADALPAWISLTGDTLTINPSETEIGDHSITVKVSDGTHTTSQTLQIKVLPGNVAPIINDQNFSVVENSINGTEVGQIVANDFNTEDVLSYEIVAGNDLNIFEVTTSGKLKIKNSINLDFEKVNQIILTVKVKDNGNPQLSAQAALTIAITDIDDEAPTLTINHSGGPIIINQGSNFVPPSATCQDRQGSCALTITNQVEVNTPGLYRVVYQATDQSGNQTIASIVVQVVAKPAIPIPQNPGQPHTPSKPAPKPARPAPIDTSPQVKEPTPEDTRPPFILKGDDELRLTIGDTYVEPGIECASVANCMVEITGKVDTSKAGSYTITYTSRHPAYSTTRTVIVTAKDTAVQQTASTQGDFWTGVWDFIAAYWLFILIVPFLWWLLLLLWRRRKDEDEKKPQPMRRRS